MLLGKRPRHPIKRTTSMTGIRPDLANVEFEEPSSAPGDQNAAHGPPLSTAAVHNHSALISPRNSTDHFLRTCGLCKRRLAPARDIFIYRGDTAFCSSECREKQIKEDEKTEYGGGKKRDDRRPPPSTAADERGSILEVRAGTGGEEASLFAMDIFKMYERYAQKKGWNFEVVDITESDLKGYKEAVAAISGAGVYGKLKFESGIHRVQRVPVTEKSGRVHTSAISVAILPQADEVDVELKNEDLRIDTFRSGGSGGQHANTTNSAVRVIHIPTGLTVSIQDERSQHMNKAKALKIICAKLYEIERRRVQSSRSKLRLEQIGSGDRSERIRTYNFPQGRVTDHRVGITAYAIEEVMQGQNLDMFIDALLLQQEIDAIASFTSSSS